MYAQQAARMLKRKPGNLYGTVRTTKHDSHAFRLVKKDAITLLMNIGKDNCGVKVGLQAVTWDLPKAAWLISW